MTNTTTLVLLALATFIFARTRSTNKTRPTWAHQLKGSQRFFGALAVVLTLLMLLNPEFLALGFLGDAAFFDIMVLALSLQMHMLAVRAFRAGMNALFRSLRWLRIPSPGLLYLLAVTKLAVERATSAFQKAMHRYGSMCRNMRLAA